MNKKNSLTLFPLFLVCYEVTHYLSMDAFLPALPSMAHDFSISHHFAQLTIILWLVGGFPSQFLIGPLSDRYGRRPVLLIGGVTFVVANLVCSLSSSLHTFLIARFVQGAAEPSMLIAGYAAIHESLERKEAIQMLARMGSVTILAPAFGPLLGGVLLVFFSWHFIFGILAVWASIALVILYFKMPETLPVEKRQRKLEIRSILSDYLRVACNRDFMKNIVPGALMMCGVMAWIFVGSFIVIDTFHYGTVGYGFFQTAVFGCFIIAMMLMRKLVSDLNMQLFIRRGLAIVLIGSMTAGLVSAFFPAQLFVFTITLMMVSFGSGLCFPILSRLAIESSVEPMGIRVTVLAATKRMMTSLASLAAAAFFTGSTFSLAIIVLFFTWAAGLMRLYIGAAR